MLSSKSQFSKKRNSEEVLETTENSTPKNDDYLDLLQPVIDNEEDSSDEESSIASTSDSDVNDAGDEASEKNPSDNLEWESEDSENDESPSDSSDSAHKGMDSQNSVTSHSSGQSSDENIAGSSSDKKLDVLSVDDDIDTSDEEDIRNTIGNIPMNWYNDYPHIGYDWEGKKIIKPHHGDHIDYFLKKMEDPNFWRTVRDPQTGQDVTLTDEDIEKIKRFEANKIPDPIFNEYMPLVEWFTSEVMETPLRKFPEHKRSFLPSKSEMKKVSKYVHALKMGWMKTRKTIKKEREESRRKGPQFYNLWKTDDAADEMRRIEHHIPAPKRALPDHSESYNPPSEYLFNEKEMKKWTRERKSLGNKKLHFVPQKYNSLREVPAYKRYIRERFLRCLDLYMCPRAIKMKLTIEPEDLVPHLPSPKDLQPFPTTLALVYEGHTDMVRSISVDPSGQYLVSASDDCTVKFWEISTGRCLKTIGIGGIGRSVAWCPSHAVCLIAVAADRKLLIINPGLADHLIVSKTDTVLKALPDDEKLSPERVKTAVKWNKAEEEQWNQGIRIILNHFQDIKQVTWHGRGDFFATVMPDGENRSVLIHHLSKWRSQLPFSKSKGLVQAVLFHPVRPFFFVATQRNIRVYDLVKQEMLKKLYSNSQWISSLALHPGGDNLLVGTYDRKVLWFDLDLSAKPYKSLMLHGAAVRSVGFHKRYPLFASCSDDKSLILSHGMVYNDLLQNALIVPVKRLHHHEAINDFSVFEVIFHPTQPWVFSSGADGTIKMFS